MAIRLIRLDGATIILVAHGIAPGGCCPACGVVSDRVHDRYQRRPLDLPWRGHQVRLWLTVRRFCCVNPLCQRRTFAEDFGPMLPRVARRTTPVTIWFRQLALESGGEAGARLAKGSGAPVSPDTLLRLLRQTPEPDVATPRVLGVDDLSLRKGHSYATLLVKLETHRPIDLLPGREAEPLAVWLKAHPGVEIVARDRSEAYAEGIRSGGSDVVQVADRFHLLQNASQALDEMLRSRRRQIDVLAAEPAPSDPSIAAEPVRSAKKQRAAARRAARVARWEEVQSRHAAGHSLRGIARDLGINRLTVRRLLNTPIPPKNQITRPRPGGLRSPMLQSFVPYLQDRWQAGCTNISQLFRELTGRGYHGSRSLLFQALQAWRPARPPPKVRRRLRHLSVRWLCLRPPDQLDPDEQAALQQVLVDDPDLAIGYALLQRFRAIIAGRDLPGLDTWLRDAQTSRLPTFISLASGILADRPPVDAALTTRWSTGLVEGHVNRVKLIKRQGYGRAKLDLLRRRVLAI